jgi:hypothetical protein
MISKSGYYLSTATLFAVERIIKVTDVGFIAHIFTSYLIPINHDFSMFEIYQKETPNFLGRNHRKGHILIHIEKFNKSAKHNI